MYHLSGRSVPIIAPPGQARWWREVVGTGCVVHQSWLHRHKAGGGRRHCSIIPAGSSRSEVSRAQILRCQCHDRLAYGPVALEDVLGHAAGETRDTRIPCTAHRIHRRQTAEQGPGLGEASDPAYKAGRTGLKDHRTGPTRLARAAECCPRLNHARSARKTKKLTDSGTKQRGGISPARHDAGGPARRAGTARSNAPGPAGAWAAPILAFARTWRSHQPPPVGARQPPSYVDTHATRESSEPRYSPRYGRRRAGSRQGLPEHFA
jgi:hypothetical protein